MKRLRQNRAAGAACGLSRQVAASDRRRAGRAFGRHLVRCVDPCTGAVIAQIAEGNAADIDRAVKSARAAFEGPWSKFKPSERQAVLLKLADLIEAEFDDIALVDTLEMGRPITPSLFFKSMIVRALRHYAGLATAIHGQTMGNSAAVELVSYTLREPVGRGRRDHPVERADLLRRVEMRARAGGGLHGGAQADRRRVR